VELKTSKKIHMIKIMIINNKATETSKFI